MIQEEEHRIPGERAETVTGRRIDQNPVLKRGAVALAMHLREIEQLAMQNALPSPEQTATLQTLVADTRRALQERY